MSVAARAADLRPSPIRSLGMGAPDGTIDLGLGVPGWPLHPVAREALVAEAQAGMPCGYGPNEGLPELVDAVVEHTGEPADRVMVSTGSQGALFALFQAHVSPGQAVLVPDPGFPAYATLTALAGGRVVRYRLGDHGRLDPDAFAAALATAGDVAVAVVNHPGNPTGGGADRAVLAQVARSCSTRGVLLVSDEVYRELHLGPRQPSVREVDDGAVVVSSVSKAWAAPGLRVGWATGREETLRPARLVHAAMVTAPSRPSQLAAAALLRHSEQVLTDSWRQLVRRWSVAQTAPAPVRANVTPAGGFYHWLALPRWARGDSLAFCRRLRDEARVTVVPGSVFGPAGVGHVRVSCGGPPADIADGLARMAPWWEAPC